MNGALPRFVPALLPVFLLLILFSGALLAPLSENGEGQGMPGPPNYLVPGHDIAYLDPNPGGQRFDVVIFRLSNTGTGQITMELNIAIEGFTFNYRASNTIPAGGDRQVPVLVGLSSTPGKSSVGIPFTVTITEWNGQPYSGPHHVGRFMAIIGQYSYPELRYNDTGEKLIPGKEHRLSVQLTNHGNIPNEFRVRIRNLEELESRGYSLSMEPEDIMNNISLEPFEERNIDFSVKAPSALWADEFSCLEISAESVISTSGQRAEKTDITIILHVKGSFLHEYQTMLPVVLITLLAATVVRKLEKRKRECTGTHRKFNTES